MSKKKRNRLIWLIVVIELVSFFIAYRLIGSEFTKLAVFFYLEAGLMLGAFATANMDMMLKKLGLLDTKKEPSHGQM